MGYAALFFILAGFPLGVLFLFLVNVPVEAVMARAQFSQNITNFVMVMIIILWGCTTVLVTRLFYKKLIWNEKRRISVKYIFLGLFLINTGVFYTLIFTDNALLGAFRSTAAETGARFTFGPYPDEFQLKKLKEEGYDGVITLLSPVIPFEKVLLEKEIAAGKQVGIKVYSFPMLPWVSSNQDAIQKIKELVRSNTGRYYVHCYLGKHRVNLAKQVIEEEQGMADTGHGFIYPDSLERGMLLSYRNGRVLLGPYPTDEEWMNTIVRSGVREIISYLDPNNREDLPWIEKERKIAAEYGLKFKLMPVGTKEKGYAGIDSLIAYLQDKKDKIYIHGFIFNEKTRLIDGYLRSGTLADPQKSLPLTLKKGRVYPVNLNLMLGPVPEEKEKKLLKTGGVTNIEKISLPKGVRPATAVNLLLDSLAGKKGVHYIYGFNSDNEIELVTAIIKNRFYGFEPDNIPAVISGHKVSVINRRLLVGPRPDEPGLDSLALQGIRTVVFVQGRDSTSAQEIEPLKNLVEAAGFDFTVADYRNGYLREIVRRVNNDNNPVYVAVPAAARHQTARELRELMLR